MLERLSLENFRSYEKEVFEFAPLTAVIGQNGIGKTNILEAISMLSLTTSWRTDKDSEVIRWGSPFCRIVGGDEELVIQAHPYLKRIKIDGISKRTFQIIGHLPTVLFQPDDIRLIYGSPADRRHYLDRVLSQVSPAYTQAILDVGQVLKHRNKLLKSISEGEATADQLPFWDAELDRHHSVIQAERRAFVAFMEERLNDFFFQMVPDTFALKVEYLQSPRHTNLSFLEYVSQQRHKELGSGVSLYGPHREDLLFTWGEHPVEQSMSRGQARSLLVACKLVELEYLSSRGEKAPILLLDDIFSELDKERREALFSVFSTFQVILTTTELYDLKPKLGEASKIIEL